MSRSEEGTRVSHTPEPPPPHGGWYPVETNGFALASLVLGISWVFGIGSILALIFGYTGKRQIDRSAGRQTGRGLAIAGIVLGWVGVGLLAVTIALGMLGIFNMGRMMGPMQMGGMDMFGMGGH